MAIKGLMVDPITNMPIIVLREVTGQRVLPIWVGVFEANAIALQVEMERIVVCELKENTFYAVLHVRSASGLHAIDARPSDAIALALRAGSRIFVEEAVVQNARTLEMAQENVDVGRLQKWLENLSDDDLGKYKM